MRVVNKVIVIKWIDTEGNTVDVLTKALPVLPFERHNRTLHHGFGNRPIQAKAKKADRPVTFKAKLKKLESGNTHTRTKPQYQLIII